MTKVYVVLEDGCVQSVMSNCENVDITIIDHDDEGWADDNSSITKKEAYDMIKKDNVKSISFNLYGTKQ